MANLKLSEAAAAILSEESAEQIFNSNIAAKNAKQDKFGQGKKVTADEQGEQDLGKAGERDDQAYTDNASLVKQTSHHPGLGKGEHMEKLPTQPGETEGRKDLMPSAIASEIEASPHDPAHVDRKKSKTHAEVGFSNKGAIKPYVPESEEEEEFEAEEASEEEVLDDVENMEESVFAEKYGMSKQDALEYMYEAESEAECAEQTKKAKKKEHHSMKVKEDMDALFSGETLSEEFKDKAAVIFEAAVQTRVDDIKVELEEEYAAEFESAVTTIVEDFASKVDSYLDYVVENWMSANELAVTKGLRTEIAEDFIGALRDVFVEHYIDVPEEKVDLVEGLVEKVESLEEKLNEEIQKNVDFKHQIAEHKKQDIIHDICEGLTLSQSEKIKSLAENVEFKSNEDYANKLGIIKESYFPTTIVTASSEALNEEIEFDEDTSTKAVDPLIDSYAKKIAQLNKF